MCERIAYSVQISRLTIKDGTAVLRCGGQRFAGGVQFVAIVTDADLKLDWFSGLLDHGGAVEDCAKAVFSPPLVFLIVEEMQKRKYYD